MEMGRMEIKELLQSMLDQANSRTVYGEPVAAEGRTVIPVARIRYGFGGGSGRKSVEEAGSGGGGGMQATPVGVVEITREGTRFLPIGQTRKLGLAVAIGVWIGLMAARRRAR
jgi:uncharacterized spore protein YtfJ